MAEIRGQCPQARLIVTEPLGTHNPANIDYFTRLQSLRGSLFLESNVIFLAELVKEYLPDEVVSDFYRLADALLLPSREEGFGIPVLEAGLAGMPIFCADIPPLRDLGLHEASYFSPDGPPREIADMILARLSASREFAFRTHVRSHYAWREIYRRQIDGLIRKGVR